MKLGIMQPYFAPYLGYFELIARCDEWVVFDTAQFIRHGWVNRNRVLHPTTAWQYVGVPVKKHHRETPISAIEIAPEQEWKTRLLGQLAHYRKRAPFFAQTAGLVESAAQESDPSLARLNVRLLAEVCAYVGIPFRHHWFSAMNLALPPVSDPGGWALEISTALRASEYLNPPGGEALFDRAEFERRGIALTIVQPRTLRYDCPGYEFVENLSILDVIMWNPPERVREFLVSAPG